MNQLIAIRDLKKRLDQYQPFPKEIIKNLNQWYRIELTYTSNAIEGNTLSRQETARVVEKGLTIEGKSIIEHLEAINHAKAWDYIVNLGKNKRSRILEQTILNIHSLILNGIDDTSAGRYRTVSVRIAGSTVTMPNALKIPSLMKEFIHWLHSSNEDIVDIAIQAHYKFVSIHPFTDGNGRTARLLMNLILIQAGYPPAIIRKEDRAQYINTIEKGQLTSDLSDHIPFMYKAVKNSLKLYIETFEPKKKSNSPKHTKLLKIGELAMSANESVATIRFWTNEGLLKVQNYSKSGYQLYNPDMIKRVQKIRRLQTDKRLTIAEIKKTFA